MKNTDHVTLRQCVGCREMKNKKEMIRVVRTPEGETCIDPSGKKNGRGAYLCRSPECLAKAFKAHSLERSLKASLEPEIFEKLKEELEKLG